MALKQRFDNPDDGAPRPTPLRRYASAVPRALRKRSIFCGRRRPTWQDPRGFVEAWIPFEEHVRELAVLRLSGRLYTPEAYRDALERFVGVSIGIKSVPELVRGPAVATTSYDPDGAGVTIWVPQRLEWWLRQYAIFHELSHIAAGHPPKSRAPDNAEAFWAAAPTLRRLARNAPPFPGDLHDGPVEAFRRDPGRFYEEEADLRAEHNMVTSSLGPRALEFDRLNQLR